MAFNLLIINYHYIRKVLPARGIYNITPDNFIEQLDAIHKNGYQFISLHDLNMSINSNSIRNLKNKSCLITFDDGLKESYEVGLGILDKMGVPAAFYAPSIIINSDKVIDVHKFHYIQGALTSNEILDLIPAEFSIKLRKIDKKIILDQYVWDDYLTAKLKYLINFILTPEENLNLFKIFFDRVSVKESELAENLYMSKQQLINLANRGFLGSHAVSHIPLASLPMQELNFEIYNSKNNLSRLTGSQIDSISYPYGGSSAVNEEVFRSAKNNFYVSGMTMLRGLNFEEDILFGPLKLKRFDTNDIFGGKSEHLYKEVFQ